MFNGVELSTKISANTQLNIILSNEQELLTCCHHDFMQKENVTLRVFLPFSMGIHANETEIPIKI